MSSDELTAAEAKARAKALRAAEFAQRFPPKPKAHPKPQVPPEFSKPLLTADQIEFAKDRYAAWLEALRQTKAAPAPGPAPPPLQPSLDQRVNGTLLGLAYGDALGCPVEGYRWWTIWESYGTGALPKSRAEHGAFGILPVPGTAEFAQAAQSYTALPLNGYPFDRIKHVCGVKALRRLRPCGIWSDDTQQCLALLGAHAHAILPRLQTLGPDANADAWEGLGVAEEWGRWVVAGHFAQAWRGIGKNFSTAVRRLSEGISPFRSANKSSGIGAAMRIAPLGALMRDSSDAVLAHLVYSTSLVTHKSLAASTAALALAFVAKDYCLGRSAAEIRGALAGRLRAQETALFLADQTSAKWQLYPPKTPETVAHRVSDLVVALVALVDDLAQKVRAHALDAAQARYALRLRIGELAKACKEAETAEGAQDGEEGEEEEASESRADAKKAPIQAFHPNQGFYALGAAHAIIMGLLDDCMMPEGGPQALLVEIIQLGYDADTVGAMIGALLGARYGEGWVDQASLYDPDRRLETYTALLRHPYGQALNGTDVPIVEQRTEFMKQEFSLTAIGNVYRKVYMAQ